MLKNFKRVIPLIMALFFIPLTVMAGEPTDRVKSVSDKLITVLSDSSLKAPEMKEKREQILMDAADEIFDWEEFSRRALAKNWNNRTPEEKKAFILLFRQLIANTYMEKTGSYSSEKILYLGEQIDGDHGNVKSELHTSTGTQIPVEYRVLKKNGLWRIYDVYIEGVSLVSNYRSQFNSIITDSSYEELVKRLKIKTEKKG
jgi:phospholipid transport system substrate-binding protein